MKLHLGCGDRYLDGYVNIDLFTEGYTDYCYANKDGVVENLATMEKYYPTCFTRSDMNAAAASHKSGAPIRKCIVDVSGDIRYLSSLDVVGNYQKIPITEIVMVQVLEHFSIADGEQVLNECYKVLAPGGKIHLDLPDFGAGVIELLTKSIDGLSVEDEEFLFRHFFGSQKNEHAYHLNGFTRRRAVRLLVAAGFTNIQDVTDDYDRPRCYPYFIMEAYK